MGVIEPYCKHGFRSNRLMIMAWLKALLLLSGDIETNPGPPKNRGPPGGVDLDIQRLG